MADETIAGITAPTPLPTMESRHFSELMGFGDHGEAGADEWRFRFTVGPELMNLAGFCHGGALLAAFDHFFSMALLNETEFKRPMATASLNCDFVNGARLNDTLTVVARIIRITRSLGFVSGVIERDGTTLAQGSGVWKFIGA